MPWCLMVWLGRAAAWGKSMAASLLRCSPTLLGFSGTPPCFISVRRCGERRQAGDAAWCAVALLAALQLSPNPCYWNRRRCGNHVVRSDILCPKRWCRRVASQVFLGIRYICRGMLVDVICISISS
ncbi:uncharacterized protein [Aegilops tauschii subsp. strangulata]|uniref:uncharacterized protein isoform X2 n=1 Tax=Aegilops tauschii subsp. strangulata TaxID=200361 RepID=UPI00098A1B34|nr:uncharacterized protein LOC109775077 isoform X2 [Aegilops tauschii subsp. strangulata]